MTVAITNSRVDYAGDGVSTVFNTTYKFLDQTHLVVKTSTNGGTSWTVKALGADYTVAGAGADEPGGSVTMVVAPPNGTTLRIERQTTMSQDVALQTSGQIPVKSLNTEFDKLTLIDQEHDRRLAALEAGAAPVTLTASKVQDTFVVADPVEGSFPRNVACVGTPTGVALMRIEDLTDGTTTYYGMGEVKWSVPVLNQFRADFVPGLTPGHNTRVTYLVITL